MKKIDLGQSLSVLANLGVIIGIAFLAVELAQNNDLIEFQMANDIATRRNAITDLVLENPEYVELMAKDVGELTDVQRDQLTLLGVRLFLNMESLYDDLTRGVADEGYTNRVLREIYWRPRLNYGARIAWDTFKRRGDPAFVAWMEENVIEPGPPE